MIVVFPKATGMCFGVKDALDQIQKVHNPRQTAIWGELVHNPTIKRGLTDLGFAQIQETSRTVHLPQPTVVITAHGVADHVIERFRQDGKEIIDTTCPLVRRAHKAVLFHARRDYFIVVVGKRGHVEVEGLTGDLLDTPGFVVLETLSEAQRFRPSHSKIALVAQTTTPPSLFQQICQHLTTSLNKTEVITVDTICQPTRERQDSLAELLPKVDALVVVGGKSSNNTKRLCEQGTRAKVPWVWVEGPDELCGDFFFDKKVVALAGGTSTPDSVIQAVHRRLLHFSRLQKLQSLSQSA